MNNEGARSVRYREQNGASAGAIDPNLNCRLRRLTIWIILNGSVREKDGEANMQDRLSFVRGLVNLGGLAGMVGGGMLGFNLSAHCGSIPLDLLAIGGGAIAGGSIGEFATGLTVLGAAWTANLIEPLRDRLYDAIMNREEKRSALIFDMEPKLSRRFPAQERIR